MVNRLKALKQVGHPKKEKKKKKEREASNLNKEIKLQECHFYPFQALEDPHQQM